MNDNHLEVTIDNGKYKVVMSKKGNLKALRHGEEWRDCCGDNLIYQLAFELDEARKKIKMAENCLVCAAIADPSEVCENTLAILQENT